jgi:hypothetical protein
MRRSPFEIEHAAGLADGSVPATRTPQRPEKARTKQDIIEQYLPFWKLLKTKPSERRARPISWAQSRKAFRSARRNCKEHDREGFRLDTYNPPVQMHLPFDWSQNPFNDKSWCRRLQSLQMAECFFDAYEQTGRPDFLTRGRDIVMDWIDFGLVRNQKIYLKWLDMVVGLRGVKIAYLVDRILSNELATSESDAAILLFAAHEHLKQLSKPAALSSFNHGVFQLHGLTILASIVWVFAESEDALRYCAEQMPQLLQNQFSDEGPHLEHSGGYHFWMREQLKVLQATGWHGELYSAEKWKRIDEACYWLTMPDRRIVPFGDTAGDTIVPDANCTNWDFRNDEFAIRWYSEAGYAFVKDSRSSPQANYLALQAGRHSTIHKHQDDLHFEMWSNGRPIFVDSASAGYKATPYRIYALSARAHNVVELADRGPADHAPANFGSGLKSVAVSEAVVTIAACAPLTGDGVSVTRQLRYRPGNSLVIRDTIASASERRFTQWLQLHHSISLHSASDSNIIFLCDDGYMIDIQIPYGASVELRRGETEPRLVGWRAIGPQKWVEAWSVGFTFIGAEMTIQTQILLNRATTVSSDGPLLWQLTR